MILEDGIKFIDEETGDELIFNFRTWLEVIKGIIVKYANKTEEEAIDLINGKNFISPKSYTQAVFYSHEIEYHWAMLTVYKDGYWLKGNSSIEPEDYSKWEKEYRFKNSLKEESFEFI